jgi:hypothetical protein
LSLEMSTLGSFLTMGCSKDIDGLACRDRL